MLANQLKPLINIFNLEEFGINSKQYINYIKPYFYDLDWDFYLFKQTQINFLIEHLPTSINNTQTNNNIIYFQYYSGIIDDSRLSFLIELLSEGHKKEFSKITTTRRRSIAQFRINKIANNICIDRYYDSSFQQNQALVSSDEYDWRMIKRIFTQADDKIFNEDFYNIIRGLSKKVFSLHQQLSTIYLVVHFTQVIAGPGTCATNAPEGIHQDGMDYIVSALVVERRNVEGGRSLVFGKDKKSLVFETTLMPGYGLFQSDKGSDLWHTVLPIYPKDAEFPAFRSTIGFDFSLTELS